MYLNINNINIDKFEYIINKHIHFIKLDMFIFYHLAQPFQNSHVKRNTKHLFLNVSYDSLLAEKEGFEPSRPVTDLLP